MGSTIIHKLVISLQKLESRSVKYLIGLERRICEFQSVQVLASLLIRTVTTQISGFDLCLSKFTLASYLLMCISGKTRHPNRIQVGLIFSELELFS